METEKVLKMWYRPEKLVTVFMKLERRSRQTGDLIHLELPSSL